MLSTHTDENSTVYALHTRNVNDTQSEIQLATTKVSPYVRRCDHISLDHAAVIRIPQFKSL